MFLDNKLRNTQLVPKYIITEIHI